MQAPANEYSRQEYRPEHNRRYAVAPAEAVAFTEPVPNRVKVNEVLGLECERRVGNNRVVQQIVCGFYSSRSRNAASRPALPSLPGVPFSA